MTYPPVMTEVDTLAAVVGGRSLARYGDGEFNLCRGQAAKAQAPDAVLQARLRAILKDSGDCLVGLPNVRSATPKAAFWRKYETAADLLDYRGYASSFITRPDSAPWINTPGYWLALESLWVGQDVTLVRGNERSLVAADLTGARSVTEVIGPTVNAWGQYGPMFRSAFASPAERVLLCLGPTATVLAVDLAAHGRHAIDLGHVGMFLRKYRCGEPMTVTAKDRAA